MTKLPKEIIVCIESKESKDAFLVAYKDQNEAEEFLEQNQTVGIYKLVETKKVKKCCELE